MNWRIIYCISFIINLNVNGQISTNSAAPFIVDQIVVEGNKVTKEKIILRELSFAVEDTLIGDLKAIERISQENIFNLQLFNEVAVDIIPLEGNKVLVLVQVVEQWYNLPIPVLEFEERNFNVWWKGKNFNRTSVGMKFRARNFRGRAEKLALTFKVGYLKELGLEYFLPGIDVNQRLGISMIGRYTERDEVNYQSVNNEREFYSIDGARLLQEQLYQIGLRYRKSYDSYHFIFLRVTDMKINNDFALIATDYLNNGNDKLAYLSLSYRFIHDTQDNSVYPLRGNFLDINLVQNGLSILDNGPSIFSAVANYRKYWEIKPRLYFQTGIRIKGSIYDKYPYALQRGLGYGEAFVRGYQDYVLDGQHYGLLRNNLKFTLVPTKIVRIPFVNNDRFNRFQYGLFLNLFSDIGYVMDDLYKESNPLNNTFLWGNGIGLDFTTSYSRVFRFEYAITKTGESGIFLHFYNSI